MSVASVEAVRPVSAAPVSEKRAVAPLVRAAEFTATVPVAVSPATERLLEKSPEPCTERRAPGVVVPMPSIPVALSKIKPPTPAFPKRTVVDAMSPLERKSVDEVAEVSVPYVVVGVKGYVPLPSASVPHENVPSAPALTSQFAVLSPETMRLVVLAVPKNPVPETEIAVELAYGKILAILEVAR